LTPTFAGAGGEPSGFLSYHRGRVMISREHVLAETRRTGKENGGKPLGRYRFAHHTDIRVVIAVGVIALLGACTEPTIKTSDRRSGDAASGSSEPAQVGDTIQLHGNDEGLVMAVTVSKVEGPAKAPGGLFGPDKGNRFVAIEIRLENAGSVVYSDSPGNGAVVVDTGDHEYDATISGLDQELGSTRIGPQDARVGLIVFEVPEEAKLRTFQLTLDSGFGPESGEWSL
jgi:hypothetical protein